MNNFQTYPYVFYFLFLSFRIDEFIKVKLERRFCVNPIWKKSYIFRNILEIVLFLKK